MILKISSKCEYISHRFIIMYHYIYSVRYFLIYKNDDVNENKEDKNSDKKNMNIMKINENEENRNMIKINENKKTENDNKYHIVFEDVSI